MGIMRSTLKRTSLETLLGEKETQGGWTPYFRYARWRHRGLVRASKEFTSRGKYPNHNLFLEENKKRIKVFADVGAGVAGGAPTTGEAKESLGPNSRVVAVDVFPPGEKGLPDGVEFLWHAIQRKPLPFQCDAIGLRNVSHYILRPVVVKTLDNIWHSLNRGGFLLGATEAQAPGSSRAVHSQHEFILVKVRKTKQNPVGFVEMKGIDKIR